MTQLQPVVRLERTIAAPPAAVYAAWLDPELVRQWMIPGDFTMSRVEIDARPGGHFRIWHALDGVESGGFDCELIELDPDRRIVFRFGFVGPERRTETTADSLLTVTLRETDDGSTALTLVHERLDGLAATMPDAAKDIGVGWDMVLTKLAAITEGGS